MLRAFLVHVAALVAYVGIGVAALDLDDLDLRQRQQQQQQQPDCDSAAYQKASLTLLSSKKFAAIYLRAGHMRQFEGSGVSIGPNGKVAVVFDNSHALGLLDSPLSETGELAGERGGSQSGWEGVAWKDDSAPATVLALREAVEVPRPFVSGSSAAAAAFSWAPPGFFPGNSSSSSSRSGSTAESQEKLEGKKKKEKSEQQTDSKLSFASGDGDGGDDENKHRKKKKRKADSTLFAVIDELSDPAIAGDPPKLLRSCPVDFPLTHENKGLEDLYYLGGGRALALCEGNFCVGGSRGREKGNGRILALRFEEEEESVFVGGERAAAAAATARMRTRRGGENGSVSQGPRPVVVPPSSSSSPPSPSNALPRLFAAPCAWRVDAVLDLPSDALFEDYSGLTVRGGLAAVLSQRDEAAFVAGFDASTLKFDPVPQDHRYSRRVFALPRSQTCERTFCTAEGIDLIDDPLVRGIVRVLVTTDKAAAGSPWNCVKTAEAVHVMSLPKHALPQAPEEGEEGVEEEEKEERKDGGDE